MQRLTEPQAQVAYIWVPLSISDGYETIDETQRALSFRPREGAITRGYYSKRGKA
jgi:hypothetical protein